MNEAIRDDDSVQTAVRNLFMGSAPEREADLAAMWEEEPKFQITPDLHEGDRIMMDAARVKDCASPQRMQSVTPRQNRFPRAA
jgi:hypothetical protein